MNAYLQRLSPTTPVCHKSQKQALRIRLQSFVGASDKTSSTLHTWRVESSQLLKMLQSALKDVSVNRLHKCLARDRWVETFPALISYAGGTVIGYLSYLAVSLLKLVELSCWVKRMRILREGTSLAIDGCADRVLLQTRTREKYNVHLHLALAWKLLFSAV